MKLTEQMRKQLQVTVRALRFPFDMRNGEQVVILNGENVNQYIRTEEVGNMASKTSANRR